MGTLGIILGLTSVVGGIFLLFFALASNIQNKSKLIFISIAIVIFGILFGITAEPSSASKDGCRICGRKTNLVAGFEMCYDCYVDFTDWQDDYYS